MKAFIAAQDWENSDGDVVVKAGQPVGAEEIEALAQQYGMDRFQVVGALIVAEDDQYGRLHFTVQHYINR